MIVVLSIAAAAALVVVAYSKLRQHSPEAGTAGLRAVRDLADVVIVCVKAVEGVVDVLARSPRRLPGEVAEWETSNRWSPTSDYMDEVL